MERRFMVWAFAVVAVVLPLPLFAADVTLLARREKILIVAAANPTIRFALKSRQAHPNRRH